MRRTWIIAGLVTAAVASAAGYQRGLNWKEFHYLDTRLMADLGQPDALIRTTSLSRLPRDLLKVPIARDVLTEDLAFYYQQNEDTLGLKGALKRIAYEHKLGWTDRILATALDESAEVALWRDGKGALRHFAIVMQRNALAKVMQEFATVALKDRQLKLAGEIETGGAIAKVYALEINPRRTLLLVTKGDRIVVLSDPGLLFDRGNKVVPAARAAVAEWLDSEGALARRFALDEPKAASAAAQPAHTLAIGAPTLALGYGSFLSGFKGVRFDFGATWSTHVWIDQKGLPSAGLGDRALWRAAPANPSACVLLPIDWGAAQKVVSEADKKPELPSSTSLAVLDGSALACWYGNSTLYAPVFIARLAKGIPDRNAALQALAAWAISRPGADDSQAGESADNAVPPARGKERSKSARIKDDVMIWRAASGGAQATKGGRPSAPAVAARGNYVVFSPDGALVDLVLDTLARKNPSVADQMPASSATLALVTPRPLAAMAEQEALAALSGPGDANLRAAAQTHLPARMKALAGYPPYRLELTSRGKTLGGWQRVEWRTPEEGK
jgi:uncharacterized protein YfaA (DUF2138 family)